jgi:hypothetical protein
MNQDRIKQMAEQAAATHGHTIKATPEIMETLTAFAALVAEDCAKMCETYQDANDGSVMADEIRQSYELLPANLEGPRNIIHVQPDGLDLGHRISLARKKLESTVDQVSLCRLLGCEQISNIEVLGVGAKNKVQQ